MASQHGALFDGSAPEGARGMARGSFRGAQGSATSSALQCQSKAMIIHHQHLCQSTFRASFQYNQALTADAASGAA